MSCQRRPAKSSVHDDASGRISRSTNRPAARWNSSGYVLAYGLRWVFAYVIARRLTSSETSSETCAGGVERGRRSVSPPSSIRTNSWTCSWKTRALRIFLSLAAFFPHHARASAHEWRSSIDATSRLSSSYCSMSMSSGRISGSAR